MSLANTCRLAAMTALLPVVCGCGPIGNPGGDGTPDSDPDAGATGDPGKPGKVVDGGTVAPVDGGHDGSSPPPPNDARAPDGYSVSGNTIYDANGKPHLFHGVDRPSLEWSTLGERLSPEDYGTMASWRANVVRIALNQDYWLSASPSFDGSYEGTVDQQVGWAKAAGLDVILDLHWSDKGDYGTASAQQRMADAHSRELWTLLANKYKGDGRVLFELYNEPHDISWDVWQSGGDSGDGFTVVGMQALYDAVRATGAENLVLIGGVSWAYDLSGVPSHRIQGHNIVYASHPYNEGPDRQRGYFDGKFGFLAATDPVILTEFGDRNAACSTGYYDQVLQYVDDAPGHLHLSWTAWGWYPKDCTFPSLITDWAGTPSSSGVLVQQKLKSY